MFSKTYDVSDRGTWCNQEVVGEHAYAAAFRKLTRAEPKVSRNEWNCYVTLVPEPDNPHSKNRTAISVRWRDHVVGYIPDADSRNYQQIRRITASGLQARTHARVWKGDYREDFYSITISLPEPDLVVPLNDPPMSGFALMPRGGSVQVTKESDHLDVLADYVPVSGRGQLLVTLHEVENGIRTKWLGVEVRVDGERIGELSKQSSGKLLGAVQHFREQGLETVCRAKIQGSSVAAEVTLLTKWAHELSEEELNPEISALPRLVPFEVDPREYVVPKAYKRSSLPKPEKKRNTFPSASQRTPAPTPQPGPSPMAAPAPYMPPPPSVTPYPEHPPVPQEAPQIPPAQPPSPTAPPMHRAPQPNTMPAQKPAAFAPAPAPPAQLFHASSNTAHSPARHAAPQKPAAPRSPYEHKTPVGRAILSGVGVTFGALFIAVSFSEADIRDVLGMMLFGFGILVPSAWWIYCNSRDKKLKQEHLQTIEGNKQLAHMLGEDHAQVTAGLDISSHVQLFRRRWLIVATLSIILIVVGLAIAPVEGA